MTLQLRENRLVTIPWLWTMIIMFTILLIFFFLFWTGWHVLNRIWPVLWVFRANHQATWVRYTTARYTLNNRTGAVLAGRYDWATNQSTLSHGHFTWRLEKSVNFSMKNYSLLLSVECPLHGKHCAMGRREREVQSSTKSPLKMLRISTEFKHSKYTVIGLTWVENTSSQH